MERELLLRQRPLPPYKKGVRPHLEAKPKTDGQKGQHMSQTLEGFYPLVYEHDTSFLERATGHPYITRWRAFLPAVYDIGFLSQSCSWSQASPGFSTSSNYTIILLLCFFPL